MNYCRLNVLHNAFIRVLLLRCTYGYWSPSTFCVFNIIIHTNESSMFQGVDGASVSDGCAYHENIVVAAREEVETCTHESEQQRPDVEVRGKKVSKKRKQKKVSVLFTILCCLSLSIVQYCKLCLN